tara:strand:+ start:12 stop:179 length:168 start_codon:yes stop_codon:yes gene_type:complete
MELPQNMKTLMVAVQFGRYLLTLEFCIGLLRALQTMIPRADLIAKQYKRMEEYAA